MNYIKQTDTFSCGPIAIANARIFQGHLKASVEFYSDFVKCKPPNGTKISNFWGLARNLGYTRIYSPTLDKLHAILDRGDAVIINHGDKKRRHYSLIIDRTSVSYGIVNHYCGATLTPVHKTTFIQDVFRDPKLWLVKKP